MTPALRLRFVHYRSRSVLVSTTTPDPTNQIFHHRDDEGVYRHFHINTLRDLAELVRCPLFRGTITPDQIQFIRANNGIEEHRIRTMPADQVDVPGLLCRFKDDTQLIVDGSHRFVWRGEHGYDWMDFYDVPEVMWRMCLLAVPPAIAPYLIA